MKPKRLHWVLLALLVNLVLPLPAQQSDVDRKMVSDLRAKAENGDAQSEYELGLVFLAGEHGVPMDSPEGVKWLRRAAEQDHAPAQNDLALCYQNGRGVPRNALEAVRWWRKAAELHNTGAQCSLGACYAKGDGVAMDAQAALEWFRKAAEQNHGIAQCNLGSCYATGRGVATNYAEAVNWFNAKGVGFVS